MSTLIANALETTPLGSHRHRHRPTPEFPVEILPHCAALPIAHDTTTIKHRSIPLRRVPSRRQELFASGKSIEKFECARLAEKH